MSLPPKIIVVASADAVNLMRPQTLLCLFVLAACFGCSREEPAATTPVARAGLSFRPSVWLSTDWFSPHGVPGFAVPFYLAHPSLLRIERRIMFDAEGATHAWCMKLMRHETGHALDTAYRLHRRKSWREHFGRASTPYTATYVPKPGSRDYVDNLDDWYAQSHPIEDFAETFAVWLASRGRWRAYYQGWPALRKLEYVDALMREIADQPPPVRSRDLWHRSRPFDF